MSLLTAHNLSKFYGGDEVFSDIALEVPQKARITLVGPNGAGKTTLINLLAGIDLPTQGDIHIAKNTRIAYLPQRPELVGSHSLWEEQLGAVSHLLDMEVRLHQLTEWMSDPDKADSALEEYTALQMEFERLGGYNYETHIKMVLSGVGFDEDDYDAPLTQLSGGQKTRALLARLLLEEPDLLILDEPTNHLDIYAVEWLENFLKGFPGAVLAVSHDRYFVDNMATTIWELEFRNLETYRGNYTHYLQQREERRELLQKRFEEQQAFISKEMDYIRKHMGSRWTAQAKGRLKKLETMKKRGKIIDHAPKNRKAMNLNIQTNLRSGDKVLMTKDLQVGYDAALTTVPNRVVYRGDVVAIIGPNGAGKTTLLKTLIGDLPPLAGESRLGANVQIGYFAQAHELLNPNNTIVEEIRAIKDMPIGEARNYLGRFLFSGDDVFRPIDTLSGGERGRVALAKLALQGANLLLLDEPTNHLDIDSQEILQAVLTDFGGTILLVSHDRYLIDALATQIWAIESDELNVFEGTYQEYVTARNQKRLESEQAKNNHHAITQQPITREKKQGLNPHERRIRLAELEATIESLEADLDSLTQAIAEASEGGDSDAVRDLGEQYTTTQQELESTMDEWEQLAE